MILSGAISTAGAQEMQKKEKEKALTRRPSAVFRAGSAREENPRRPQRTARVFLSYRAKQVVAGWARRAGGDTCPYVAGGHT